MIWTSSVTLTLTLTQIAKAIGEGDAHIARVLGMDMPISHHINVGSSKSEGPGNDITPVVTLDDPFAASLDYELSLSRLSPSPAKLSHPENGFT